MIDAYWTDTLSRITDNYDNEAAAYIGVQPRETLSAYSIVVGGRTLNGDIINRQDADRQRDCPLTFSRLYASATCLLSGLAI